MKKFWFKRKLYGWGWYPAAWQGWLVLGAYTAIMAVLASVVTESSSEREVFFMLVLPFFLLTAALIGICYRTGESPRWQWGAQETIFPEIIAFDLDGTLSESKMPIDSEMAGLLSSLMQKKKVAIISGAGLPQLHSQVLDQLKPETPLGNLYLLPTNGAALFSYDGQWLAEYESALSAEEKAKIFAAFKMAFTETNFVQPADLHGILMEDRGAQITFSALGSTAPTVLKAAWDPDHIKRLALQKVLKMHLPEFSVSIGGMTSIDVTKGVIDKAYGIGALLANQHIDATAMLFVGDALFAGGNDASVLTLGIVAKSVATVEETKQVIRNLVSKSL